MLQAQTAAFAQESPDAGDREAMLTWSAEAPEETLRNPDEALYREITTREYARSEAGQVSYAEPGTVRKIADKQSYAEWLRTNMGAGNTQAVVGRAALTINHKRYFNDETLRAHRRELGRGESVVAEVFEHNGTQYVAKRALPKYGAHAANVGIDNRALASINASYRPRPVHIAEQVVAARYGGADPEVISLLRPGTGIGDLSTEQLDSISYPQLQELAEGLVAAGDGLALDVLFKPDNILHDTVEGFSLIDLGVPTPDGTNYPMAVPDAIKRTANFLGLGKTDLARPDSVQEYGVLAHELRARLGVVQHFKQALGSLSPEAVADLQEFGESTVQSILDACDATARACTTRISQYEDPAWAMGALQNRMRTGNNRRVERR